MKIFLCLSAAILILSVAGAQGSWQVILNNKIVLNTSVEDTGKNVLKITKADLKKKNEFSVVYKEKAERKNWQRTLMAYDERDMEIKVQKGNKFQIKNTALQIFFKSSRIIRIYTLALPTDPRLKASIRVRRVHLCTLVLE